MLADMTTTTSENATGALEALLAAAKTVNAVPLWPVLGTLSTPEPRPKAVPHVWPFAVMRPFCEAAAKLVGTEYAERRVFSLINPALGDPYTTDTLYAGLQTILPGEVARAHRHTIFALRFIIEGDRAYTAVEGEKVMMQRGDLVLTPQDEWHDHGNEGDNIMIWMDGLDHPIWRAVPLVFTEHYGNKQFPSEITTKPSVRKYPWSEMQAQLDAAPGTSAEVPYVHRGTGGEIAATIGASALRVNAGTETPPLRETSSSIVNVYEGSGTVTIGEETLRFAQGDIIAVPAWKKVRFRSDPGRTMYLFRMHDRPLVRALNAYRSDDGSAKNAS
jgi:gentisate 1,2-dioxygenase